MIIHKLIAHHLSHQDDPGFYVMQAEDAIGWIERQGVKLGRGVTVLDLGAGHGIFGGALMRRGCEVVFADEANYLLPEFASASFLTVNLDRDDVEKLGTYDLVICSNVLEHLAKPEKFIHSMSQVLRPGGHMYLSWTNWLSPWGGHEFSPFHYLGTTRGHLWYDRIVKKPRKHTPYKNLFPTYIGKTLSIIKNEPGLGVVAVVPRYYSEFGFIMSIPIMREFLAWNCAMLVRKQTA